MTTSDYTGSTGTSASTGGSMGASDRTKQAAGAAAEDSKHLAGTAQDEARRVGSEASSQLHELMDRTTREVEEQSRSQKDRLVEVVRGLSDELDSMASQGQNGPATQLAREAAQRAHALCTHLEKREPRDLLEDVRGFARRKPGTFLLGAMAAGVVAGRLTRGMKDASSSHGGSGSGYAGAGTQARVADVTSPGDPLTTGRAAPSSGPAPGSVGAAGTAVGTPLAGTGTPAGTGTSVTDPTTDRMTRGLDDPLTDPLPPSSDPSQPGGRP